MNGASNTMTANTSKAISGVSADQYIVWCPSSVLNTTSNNVIRAMYYLPKRFVLMLPRTTMSDEIASTLPIADRIRSYETNSSSNDELLHIAQAVICDEQPSEASNLPSIKVSDKTEGVTQRVAGYDSTSSPEAIATALLRLSHATV